MGCTAGDVVRRCVVVLKRKKIKIRIFLFSKASRRKALRAAMMEEFRVAEEAREANVKINQLSQDEVSWPFNDPKL